MDVDPSENGSASLENDAATPGTRPSPATRFEDLRQHNERRARLAQRLKAQRGLIERVVKSQRAYKTRDAGGS